MRNIIFIPLLLVYCFSFSQKEVFSTKGNKFHYSVRYINETGDTIIQEKMVMEITGKRWFFQPRVQDVIIYRFNIDTNHYKKYIDPEKLFRNRDLNFYKRKKKYYIFKSEKTGLRIEDSLIYFHPPRVNQFRMLFYAPHPFFWFPSMEKKHQEFEYIHIKVIGKGTFIHKYTIDSLGIQPFNNNESVKLWKVHVASKLKPVNEYYREEGSKFDSELNALFCKEYGFIQLYNHFKNGVKIEFDLDYLEKK
jgi:hypothetical protein